ncbi:MAG: hypothetical protein ACM3O9_01440 [Methylocystaceae bacterium]
MTNEIVNADIALIGGSSTLSIQFPQELKHPDVEVEATGVVYSTPYGDSPPFTIFTVNNGKSVKRVLTCRMHGWRQGVSRRDASRQIFFVFRAAGVKRVLAEGGVGSISRLLKPRDIIIPDDYIDGSLRSDVGLDDNYLLVMRDPMCREMTDILTSHSEQVGKKRVFDRGVYVVTDGRHFESAAEVSSYRMAGGDVIGQSLTPEVYLAREIGACFAGIYQVVNYAEGVIKPWEHEELSDIFYNESLSMGQILINTIQALPTDKSCTCAQMRKETLLKDIYK